MCVLESRFRLACQKPMLQRAEPVCHLSCLLRLSVGLSLQQHAWVTGEAAGYFSCLRQMAMSLLWLALAMLDSLVHYYILSVTSSPNLMCISMMQVLDCRDDSSSSWTSSGLGRRQLLCALNTLFFPGFGIRSLSSFWVLRNSLPPFSPPYPFSLFQVFSLGVFGTWLSWSVY